MKSDDQLSVAGFRPGGTTESSPAIYCRDHGRKSVRPGGTLDGREATRRALQPSLRDGIRGEAHPALKCRATLNRPSGTGRTRKASFKFRHPELVEGSASRRFSPSSCHSSCRRGIASLDDKISRFHFGHASDSEVAAVVPNGGACRFYRPQAPPLGTAAATSEPAPDVIGSRRPPGDGHAYRPSPGGRRLPFEVIDTIVGIRDRGTPLFIPSPNTRSTTAAGGRPT